MGGKALAYVIGCDAVLGWLYHTYTGGLYLNMIMAVWFCAGFGSATGLFLCLKLRATYEFRDAQIATYDENVELGLRAGCLGSVIPKAAKVNTPPPPMQRAKSIPKLVSDLPHQLELKNATIKKQMHLIDRLDPLIGAGVSCAKRMRS